MMQNALLQEGALNPGTTDPVGLNNRILRIDLTSGTSHEYVYGVEASNRGQGVSEILAINDHQFVVVERDNRIYAFAIDDAELTSPLGLEPHSCRDPSIPRAR
jgi:hypothetical protein